MSYDRTNKQTPKQIKKRYKVEKEQKAAELF